MTQLLGGGNVQYIFIICQSVMCFVFAFVTLGPYFLCCVFPSNRAVHDIERNQRLWLEHDWICVLYKFCNNNNNNNNLRDRPKVIFPFTAITESGTVTQQSVSAVTETVPKVICSHTAETKSGW